MKDQVSGPLCSLPGCDEPMAVTIDFGTGHPGVHHRCADHANRLIVSLRLSLDEAEGKVEYLGNQYAAMEYTVQRLVNEREGLMIQVDEQRRLWNASRHYKRLREYRQRTHAAELRAEQAEARLS